MCFAPSSRGREKNEAMSMTYEALKSRGNEKRTPHKLIAESKLHGWTWQACGAVFGLAGGVITVIFGSLLTASTWIVGTEGYGSFLRVFGTVLMVLTIPLLIFGAHCLDLQDKMPKQTDRM